MCRLPASKSAKYKLPFLLCWGRVLQRLSSDCHACNPYAAAPRTHSGAQKADFRRQASECARRRGESAPGGLHTVGVGVSIEGGRVTVCRLPGPEKF